MMHSLQGVALNVENNESSRGLFKRFYGIKINNMNGTESTSIR